MLDFFSFHVEKILVGVMVLVFVGGPLVGFLRRRRDRLGFERSAEKAEAFFKASFPELQPHFHPESVAAYVLARSGRQFSERREWTRPAGFGSAAVARFDDSPQGERTTLLDAAGMALADFVLEPKPGAVGALRVGQGKFTVRQDPGKPPRVSYWHPDREFSWKGRGRWKFTSRLADEPIDTTDRNWSRSTSDWSPTTTAAAAAGIVGLGGSFDGGGASAGWDADGKEGTPASGEAGFVGDSSSGDSSSGDSSSGDSTYGDSSSGDSSSGDSSSDTSY